jgi:TraY domain
MARKRAPGGGRKPAGPFKGKNANLTTRITTDTRAALERAAKRSGRSLSQEAERRLDESFRRDLAPRSQHLAALGPLIVMVAQRIESVTGKDWRLDSFTCEALREGIDAVLSHFGASGDTTVPPKVLDAAAKLPAAFGETYKTVKGLGQLEGGVVIVTLENASDMLESGDRRESYRNFQLLRDLGSGWNKEQRK